MNKFRMRQVFNPIADANRYIQEQLTKQIQEAAFPVPKPVLIVIGQTEK